ncbi:hypothetical protein AB4Z18_14195 [Leifsonia sp. 2TAF2]|uniref:hypothetical protein n=1 Tax=Leifsonia sp. 2TAF2 TaxID=3233009 RepID=UPI003F9DEC4F
MERWTDFAVILGGSMGALVGLLFVAVSIRADAIAHSHRLRARVAQILAIFLGLLIAAILTALPNPTLWALGVELLALAVGLAASLWALGSRARRIPERQRLEKTLDRLNPDVTTVVLIALCAVGLLFGLTWALFLLALAAIVGIVGGGVGAWLVLVRPDE